MPGNTISTTLVLSSVLGAGFLANIGKATGGLNLIGMTMADIRKKQKTLKKEGGQGNEVKRLGDINASLGRVNQSIGGIGKSFKSLFKFIGAGAGVATSFGGALFGLAKSTADYASEVGHTAAALGLGMDALQEFRYSASLANVEASAFDDAVKKLNLDIGKSLAGSGGEAAKAFERLGLGLHALEAMESEDRLLNIGDALKKVTSETERATLSSMIFGAGKGAQVGAWLSQGSAALSADRAESRKTGGNATQDDFKNAQNFGKALADLKAVAAGLWRSLGAQALVPIGDVLKNVTGFIKENKDAFISGFSSFISAAKTAMLPLTAFIKGVLKLFSLFAKSPASITIAIHALGALGVVILALKIGTMINSIVGMGAALLNLSRSIGIAKAVMLVFNTVLAANPIGLIVMAIGVVVAAVGLLILHWNKVKAAFVSFNDWLDRHPVFDFILRILFPFLGAIRVIRRNWDSIMAFFAATWNGLKFLFSWSPIGLIIRYWEPIKSFFGILWEGIKSGVLFFWDILKTIFSWSPLGLVIKAYGVMFNWLEKKFGVFSKIGGAIKGVARFLGFGKDEKQEGKPDGATAARQQSLIDESKSIKQEAAQKTATAAARVDVGGITINAAPGQSEKEIAAAVADELEARQQAAADSLLSDLAHA
jgi:hypothetical protein